MKELLQLILFDSQLPDLVLCPFVAVAKKTFARDCAFEESFSYSCEEALFFVRLRN
jgi:hypothetical protein